MKRKARQQRVDPLFIDLFKEYQKQGLVHDFPEFTRKLATDIKFKGKFKFFK